MGLTRLIVNPNDLVYSLRTKGSSTMDLFHDLQIIWPIGAILVVASAIYLLFLRSSTTLFLHDYQSSRSRTPPGSISPRGKALFNHLRIMHTVYHLHVEMSCFGWQNMTFAGIE